ncbi:C4-dicarboxylate ABC transporter substrate-binding protein [Rhodobacteraceae bacterium WD3A24]|nr:C4-dicarboxylate ABC transporter substrate-binding protein [Rhodobacteraceae bacterium WD3A24]
MNGKLKLGLAASTLALAAAGANAQEYEFTLHHLLSAQAPAHTDMLVPWAERVEELSDGRVSIEIFPNMTLGGRPPELITQARDGVVDIVWTVNGYTPGLFPRTEVMELPTVFEADPVAANLALYDMYNDGLISEDYAAVEVMWLHTHRGQGLHMAEESARTPEDLAGTSLRIPTRTGSWVIEALGASPVAMPVPELPQALSRGTVDGALIPWEIIPPLQIQEQTQYQIEGADGWRLGSTTFQVSMNQARWDSLPEDIQAAFREASGREWWAEVGEIWTRSDEVGLQVALDAGNEYIELTEEETQAFRDALTPVVQRWIDDVSEEGIDGEMLVDRARELVDQYSE